ncbi:hypothetical protein ScPMuIL_007917 [Solemya velum]
MFLNGEDEDLSDMFYIWKSCVGILVNTSGFAEGVGQQICASHGFLEWMEKTLTIWYTPHLKKRLKKEYLNVMEDLISIIHNCCMLNVSAIPPIRALGFVTLLERYLDTPFDLIRIATIAALADILEEKECSVLKSNESIIRIFINVLREATKAPERDCFGWEVVELARTLGQLAKIDANKTLLFRNGALGILSGLSSSTYPEEQKEAVNTIGHLAFDDEIQESLVSGDNQLIVDKMIELNQSPVPGVREAALSVLWTLSGRLKKSDKYHNTVSQMFKKKSKGHIMISYSSEHRQTLLKVKSEMESSGFSVWMDVDEMREDIYDRMAEGVMGAAVVLICISRRYKQSKYCRQEARFADQLNKQLAPLKMESDYEPDGWLDLMTAGMTYYDFSGKYRFEVPLEKLLKELHKRVYKGTSSHIRAIPCTETEEEPIEVVPHDLVSSGPNSYQRKGKQMLGKKVSVNEDCQPALERSVCCLYGKPAYTDINKLRYDLARQKFDRGSGPPLSGYGESASVTSDTDDEDETVQVNSFADTIYDNDDDVDND